MPDYEISKTDRALLAKVSKALAYLSWGDPLKDSLDHEDITDALALLMRVIPNKERENAVSTFTESFHRHYGEDPDENMLSAVRGFLE